MVDIFLFKIYIVNNIVNYVYLQIEKERREHVGFLHTGYK